MSNVLSGKLIEEVKSNNPRILHLRAFLLEGADINFQDNESGYTALMIAAEGSKDRTVEYLLQENANPLIKNHNNEIASDLVSSDLFIYSYLKDFELLFATQNNDLKTVKATLEAGALINFQGQGGYTGLLVAVEEGLVEMVEYYLWQGADMAITCADGRGVFELASNQDIYSLLRDMDILRNGMLHPPKKTAHQFFSKTPLNGKINYGEVKGAGMFDFSKINIQPRFSKYKPAATEDQIAEIEKYCSHKLPDNYKKILKNYNGSIPGATYFDAIDNETGIHLERELAIFYCLDENKESSENIWYAITKYSRFIGPNTLPFADDGNRQIYYIKWENDIPQVWYLSYLDLDEPETYLVNDSFDDLLESLYEKL